MSRGILAALTLALAIGASTTLAGAADSFTAMDTVIHRVELEAVPARAALEWLSVSAGFNLVVSWKQLEAQGHDPEAPVTLRLNSVKARTVLKLLLQAIFNDPDVVAQVNRDYIHIRTKQAAAEDAVVRVYPIQDLLHEIPDFTQAPEFDLNQIAADSGGGGGGSTIFTDTDEDDGDRLTRAEHIDQLMDTIRNAVEPEIWRANGGLGGSITHYNGNLIISAPEYVHRQIGMPGVDSIGPGARDATPAATTQPYPRAGHHRYRYRGSSGASHDHYRHGYGSTGRSNGVSGIDWTAATRYR